MGKFRDGKPHGLFTETAPDGTSSTVEYRDSKPVNEGDSEAGDTRP